METYSAHRAPWACVWGRFGSRSAPRPGTWLLANSFWLCRHPELAAGPRPVERRDCETCPLWEPAAQSMGQGEQKYSAPRNDGEF